MKKIRHSHGCVNEHDIIKLRSFKKFDVDLNVMGSTMTRKMVKVRLPFVSIMHKDEDYQSYPAKDYYVDVVTGTMYDPEQGKCSSSKIFIEAVYL